MDSQVNGSFVGSSKSSSKELYWLKLLDSMCSIRPGTFLPTSAWLDELAVGATGAVVGIGTETVMVIGMIAVADGAAGLVLVDAVSQDGDLCQSHFYVDNSWAGKISIYS